MIIHPSPGQTLRGAWNDYLGDVEDRIISPQFMARIALYNDLVNTVEFPPTGLVSA